MIRQSILISLLLLAAGFPVFAIDTPFNFRGARPMGMGDAFTAIADDENAISYNPAGMVRLRTNRLAVYGKLFFYDFIPTSLPENYTNNMAGASVAFNNFGFQAFYSLLGDDLTVIDGKSILKSGMKITAAFAYDSGVSISVGAAANVLAQSEGSGGVSFDLGFLYFPNSTISFAIVFKDIITSGSSLIVDDYGFPRPVNRPACVNMALSARPFDKFIMAFEVKNVTEAAGEINIPTSAEATDSGFLFQFKRSFHLGLEYTFLDNYTLRAGMFPGEDVEYAGDLTSPEYVPRTGFTAGAGVKLGFVRVDFAVANDMREVYNIKSPVQVYGSASAEF